MRHMAFNRSRFRQRQRLNWNSLSQPPACECRLLNLPNELLEMVLDFVIDPATLAALAHSCTHLKLLAVPRISKRAILVANRNLLSREATYQVVEQYLSIPQINKIRELDPTLLGPPPFLPGRYGFGVPPQVRYITEAVIDCKATDNITTEYVCAFLRNARNLRLIQIIGHLPSNVMAEMMLLENLQGLYFADSTVPSESYRHRNSQASILFHIWTVEENDTVTAAISTLTNWKSLRLLTVAKSVRINLSLAMTLRELDSNHQLLASLQSTVHDIFQRNITSVNRVIVTLPAIDCSGHGIFRLQQSEASILATLPDAVTRFPPMDLARNIRFLVVKINILFDTAVLSLLTQLETLKIYLPGDFPDVVAAALQDILGLQDLKSLSIWVQPILSVGDVESVLRSLTALTELEIPIHLAPVETMKELRAFRFGNLETIKLWPINHWSVESEPGLYDLIEDVIEVILRLYGRKSDPASWDKLQFPKKVRCDLINPDEWRISTDEMELALLQDKPFMWNKVRIVNFAEGRRVWFQRQHLNQVQSDTWPWLDNASEALGKKT